MSAPRLSSVSVPIDQATGLPFGVASVPVGVVGWGRSGQASARALAARGCVVYGYDQREPAERPEDVGRFFVDENATRLAEAVIADGVGLIVISPGVGAHSPVFEAAFAAGIPVWSEVELAWNLQQAGPHRGRPWLTVTGTNGKTTTVGLLDAMLRAAGKRSVAVGNIGVPVVEMIDSDAEVFAVELSSFQLYSTYSVSPLAAVCINVDADHVDWHGSVEAYVAAKARVYENTQVACVYPAADAKVESMVAEADVVDGARAIGVTLGTPGPSQCGLVEDILVERAFVANRHKEAAFLADLDDVRHSFGASVTPAIVLDVLVAAALARAYGVAPEAVREGIRSYVPQGHRRAFVTHAADMDWINDSKATNGHAVVASLRGIAPGTAVWIAGGDLKGQSFDDVIPLIQDRLRGVVVIGAQRESLCDALQRLAPGVPFVEVDEHEDWMFSVVNEAVALSRPGDTVILAPGAASWDQFSSYAQRGEVFVDAVMRLADQWAAREAELLSEAGE